jgi:hypothetical protein
VLKPVSMTSTSKSRLIINIFSGKIISNSEYNIPAEATIHKNIEIIRGDIKPDPLSNNDEQNEAY